MAGNNNHDPNDVDGLDSAFHTGNYGPQVHYTDARQMGADPKPESKLDQELHKFVEHADHVDENAHAASVAERMAHRLLEEKGKSRGR